MFLSLLKLTNFKNHILSEFVFKERIVIFIGRNGVGKTNVLDAIHYLAVFKSFVNLIDSQLVSFDAEFFRIDAQLENEYHVVAKYAQGKKTIEINESKITKYSKHFGHIPLILSSPADIFLFYGGSEERRRLIDYTISTYDREYLHDLNTYNSYLEQRNAYLKSNEVIDSSLLTHYDDQLIAYGFPLFKKREEFLGEFISYIDEWYKKISLQNEHIRLDYRSQLLDSDYRALINSSKEKDKILKRTSKGIHRDDIEISMNQVDIKKIGSQGQQKSLLYAIRLSQAELISKKLNQKVVFLLDDFSDRLDLNRRTNLLNYVSKIDFVSQWFITDTKEENFDTIPVKEIFNI